MAAGDGLISMTPTSIAYSGTSASINADGGVDFSAVTSLSLNGVFTGDYDNYLVAIRHSLTSNAAVLARMRVSGSDATGTDYAYQQLSASSTTVSGTRGTSQSFAVVGIGGPDQRSGDTCAIYGPYLAQPTAFRNVNARGLSGAALVDYASTHSLSTSYDSITLYLGVGDMTGNLHVFGYEE